MTYWLIDTENSDEHVPLEATNKTDAIAEARRFFRDLYTDTDTCPPVATGFHDLDIHGYLYVVLPDAKPENYEHADGEHVIHGVVVAERVCDIIFTAETVT
jgi:hypothetical protein